MVSPGPWLVAVTSFGEMLPYAQNRITLHSSKRDRWGIPLVDIDCSYQSNELKMLEVMNADPAWPSRRFATDPSS